MEASIDPAVRSGDLGQIVQLQKHRRLTECEKMFVLKHCYVPPQNYKFPITIISGRRRHFQNTWLHKYDGLAYSESENGGFCKYCVVFGRSAGAFPSRELVVFVTKPFVNFKKASEKFQEHFNESRYHKSAKDAAITFSVVMDKRELAIDNQLNKIRKERIAKNRRKLLSIVETLIFCGRQGIAFRGHRDDQSSCDEDELANHGNFLSLLQFRVQAGDTILEEHLQTAQGNALYTSKTIQNELIVVCGNIIRQQILSKVKKAMYLSVMADEATDSANIEQLSVSVRFVDGGSCEKFLGFLKCESGVTGDAIAENLLSQLYTWQLPPSLLRGQSYDGAGAMAGHTRGAAARILAKYPKAIYVHCAAHRLNLCVMKACSIQVVNNMMQTADSVSRFFNNSPKRQLALEKWIDSVLPEEERRKKLKEMCRTRWIERHEAFEVFIDLFLPTVSCLKDIVHAPVADWNRETRSDA